MHNYVVLILFAVAGCTSGPPAQQMTLSPFQLTAPMLDKVKTSVAAALKDPESARFGLTAATREKDGRLFIVCGLVNAKNSYGGYTGMKPFIGSFDQHTEHFSVTNMGGTSVANINWANNDIDSVIDLCKRYGLTITGFD